MFRAVWIDEQKPLMIKSWPPNNSKIHRRYSTAWVQKDDYEYEHKFMNVINRSKNGSEITEKKSTLKVWGL